MELQKNQKMQYRQSLCLAFLTLQGGPNHADQDYDNFSLTVTLSKTEKKGREHKESIVSAVRKSFDDFKDLYVFEFENMRNAKLKEFRDELKDTSR